MSEYQSYEFVALDRPLTTDEMAELRAISTRAEITPTRFWNEYQWGDLKADPADLLARYFDVHVYFANWGTRRLMLRLPRAAVDVTQLRAYLPGGPASLATSGEHAVVDMCSETDEPEDDWYQAEHLCGSLTPLRAELLRGDLRAAYLAWLLAVQDRQVAEETVEPPVPHGIGSPSALLQALAEFLRLDRDLIAAVAEAPATKPAASGPGSRTCPCRSSSAGCCAPPRSRSCRWARSCSARSAARIRLPRRRAGPSESCWGALHSYAPPGDTGHSGGDDHVDPGARQVRSSTTTRSRHYRGHWQPSGEALLGPCRSVRPTG
jgi:hypothetical protein